MIQLPIPTPLVGDLLRTELATAGLATGVIVADDWLILTDLAESQRAQAASVVQAHAATAQAALDRAASERANEATIQQRATGALATNATFLAIASPTNAQIAAQVKALTRQNNGLIRLALRRFDSAD